MKYTEAIRKTVVTGVDVSHRVKGKDSFFPSWAFKESEDIKEVWWVWLTTRSGLLPEKYSHRICRTQEEAAAYVDKYSVGTEINVGAWVGHGAGLLKAFRKMVEAGKAPGVDRAGDDDSPLAFDVLNEAGITDWDGISAKVKDFLGRQRIDVLKNKFGENWSTAAVYEYCCLNLPNSSTAYVAAAYQFHWYITGNDFTAGYLWRDLECLVYGVESAAVKSLEMRKKAGASGSKKSAKAREERRLSLMRMMEHVAERNPDIVKLGAKIVADLALSSCVEEAPVLWAQGQGQVDEYLGEMRRGEAGEGLQSRYLAMFPKKPLKRLAS